ncbi:hypothetical protein RHMOL_Rhmol01G0353500 [Rhododendron molle]|uniref:Uncharacterized protein n=1 Tax=Rhododendron molle TaxID=49168 RepID=A0ACC0Q9L6_RHOML|nr:hypothetical protein RHMOL_Rhmol01G0353500 [Rhododendron molle]
MGNNGGSSGRRQAAKLVWKNCCAAGNPSLYKFSDEVFEQNFDRQELLEAIVMLGFFPFRAVLMKINALLYIELWILFEQQKRQSDIDGWIALTFRKRVKKLKLNFACNWLNANWNYPLTAEILHGYSLDSPTSLYLCHVDVTEEVPYYYLSVCPSLEELSVLPNKCLVNFSVSGPSLKLRHLEIQDTRNLGKLDICDSNLVSFKYTGQKTSISLKDTPLLVKASFGLGYACTTVKNFIRGSSYLQQLETLVLVPSCVCWHLVSSFYFLLFFLLSHCLYLLLTLLLVILSLDSSFVVAYYKVVSFIEST